VTAAHDLAQGLGLLVVGAASAATLNVAIPRSWLLVLGDSEIAGVVTLAVLAVLLAVCSEADAFIASSLSQFSLTARLSFMTVGPAIDVKFLSMQIGTFGRRFALRFALLTFVATLTSAVVVGWRCCEPENPGLHSPAVRCRSDPSRIQRRPAAIRPPGHPVLGCSRRP
jgi:uncharacterized membrane protein YraQ (UPF0718 family)